MLIRLWATLALGATVLATPGCDALAGGAGVTPSKAGTWKALPGITSTHIWRVAFDRQSHPLVAGYGGVWRYTEADGWLQIGKLGANVLVSDLFPAANGDFYAVTASKGIFLVPQGASSWTDFDPKSTSDDIPGLVTANPSDGTFWAFLDASHNLYSMAQDGSITRKEGGKGSPVTVVDCHTKDLLQCGSRGKFLTLDGKDGFYFMTGQRVFHAALAGGTPTLVAQMPEDQAYPYFKSAWVTSDGTVYITEVRSDDAYGYGDTWRFKPGDPKGSMVLKAPTNFGADLDDVPEAPGDSFLAVAPDGTLYSYAAGGVSRYTP